MLLSRSPSPKSVVSVSDSDEPSTMPTAVSVSTRHCEGACGSSDITEPTVVEETASNVTRRRRRRGRRGGAAEYFVNNSDGGDQPHHNSNGHTTTNHRQPLHADRRLPRWNDDMYRRVYNQLSKVETMLQRCIDENMYQYRDVYNRLSNMEALLQELIARRQ
jgi:hypothetical protein